jgi:hypothetical protein
MMEFTDTPGLVKTKNGVTGYNRATISVAHMVMTSNWGRVDAAVDATIEGMDPHLDTGRFRRWSNNFCELPKKPPARPYSLVISNTVPFRAG